MRGFGIKHNRYANWRVALVARWPFVYLSNLVQRAWFLIPNAPINPSRVRIFIVPKMHLLSPDDA